MIFLQLFSVIEKLFLLIITFFAILENGQSFVNDGAAAQPFWILTSNANSRA